MRRYWYVSLMGPTGPWSLHTDGTLCALILSRSPLDDRPMYLESLGEFEEDDVAHDAARARRKTLAGGAA